MIGIPLFASAMLRKSNLQVVHFPRGVGAELVTDQWFVNDAEKLYNECPEAVAAVFQVRAALLVSGSDAWSGAAVTQFRSRWFWKHFLISSNTSGRPLRMQLA